MASTNKTANYELSQFIETDRPAWLTDYNGDMRKLDTALKAVSDVASGASGGISSLTDRMTAAEGAITTNANDITALDARTDALEAGAQSTAGTIANIQTEQTAQNLGIEAATELGYNLARPYDSASTYTVGSYVLFQNTLYKCVTAVSTGEAFDPTKWIAIKATDEISGGGVTISNSKAYQLITCTGARQARGSDSDLIEYPSNKIFVHMNSYTVIGNLRILSVALILGNTIQLPAIVPMTFIFDYAGNIDKPSSPIRADAFSVFADGEAANNAQPFGIGNLPSMSDTKFTFEITKQTTALTSIPGITFVATFVYTV